MTERGHCGRRGGDGGLRGRKKAVEERIRDLRPGRIQKRGLFPKEIFEAQQDKLRLETEILIRKYHQAAAAGVE